MEADQLDTFSTTIGEYIIHERFLDRETVNHLINLTNQNYDCSANHYIPYRFSEIDWERLVDYYDSTNRFIELYNAPFLEAFRERLKNYFTDFEIRSIQEADTSFVFNPFTIRVLHPGQIDIHQHCENISIHVFHQFFQHLLPLSDDPNQYSFLIMLQPPENGGEVVIYDEYWQGMATVENQIKKLRELDQAGETHHIKHTLSLQAGDLLIFPSGKTWHKVNQAYGQRPRITLGGFLGFAKNEPATLYFWS